MYFKTENAMPELVAAKDKSRPALSKVHLDAERAEVMVTDSYMAARFPVVVEEGDTSGPIPVEALKASRKPPLKNCPETSITLNGDVQVKMLRGEDASASYLTMPRESLDYTFPDLRQLWPQNLGTFEIALDADKLLALAKSFGKSRQGHVVRLRFCEKDGELSPLGKVSVRPLRGDEDSPSAILMPVRIN